MSSNENQALNQNEVDELQRRVNELTNMVHYLIQSQEQMQQQMMNDRLIIGNLEEKIEQDNRSYVTKQELRNVLTTGMNTLQRKNDNGKQCCRFYKETPDDDDTIVGYIPPGPGVNGVNDGVTVAMAGTYVALKKSINSIPQ